LSVVDNDKQEDNEEVRETNEQQRGVYSSVVTTTATTAIGDLGALFDGSQVPFMAPPASGATHLDFHQHNSAAYTQLANAPPTRSPGTPSDVLHYGTLL
jgi:hypothetical protein